MAKRVIDGEALWASDKLHACPLWARKEYPWLYSLADAFGSFELNLRVIAGKMHPNRPDLSEKKLGLIFSQFGEHGLAFTWSENGKSYVHWTGSEKPGRLPSLSRRTTKFERRLAPPVPKEGYESYLQRFGENSSVGLPHKTMPSASASASASAKAHASAREKHIAQASPSLDAFEPFWKAYPNKVGKPAARKAWKKIKPVEHEQIIIGILRWISCEQWQNPQFIPYPATFLNQRRWEDEPPATDRHPESAVGRGPEPTGEARPLPAEVQEKLVERQRLDNIADLERYLAEGHGNPSIRGKCRKRIEELKKKAPVNP